MDPSQENNLRKHLKQALPRSHGDNTRHGSTFRLASLCYSSCYIKNSSDLQGISADIWDFLASGSGFLGLVCRTDRYSDSMLKDN